VIPSGSEVARCPNCFFYRGYDSSPFRGALAKRGIADCIPSNKNRKQPIS